MHDQLNTFELSILDELVNYGESFGISNGCQNTLFKNLTEILDALT